MIPIGWSQLMGILLRIQSTTKSLIHTKISGEQSYFINPSKEQPT